MACRSWARSRSPGDGPSWAPARRPSGRPLTCPGTPMPPPVAPEPRPRPRNPPLVQQPRATCELEGEPLIRIVEIHLQQLRDATQAVGPPLSVQVKLFPGPHDRGLLVEGGRKRTDRDVSAGRGQLFPR